jgi:hypothetical protein
VPVKGYLLNLDADEPFWQKRRRCMHHITRIVVWPFKFINSDALWFFQVILPCRYLKVYVLLKLWCLLICLDAKLNAQQSLTLGK